MPLMADTYRGSVQSYLRSKLGESTSPYVASQLYELPHLLLGLGEQPNHAQLHVTRAWLEATQEELCERREECRESSSY